jgi:hypothetical protein
MMRKHASSCLIVLLLLAMLLSACTEVSRSGDPTATPESFFPPTVEVTGSPLLPINPTPTPDLVNPNPVRITELQYLQEDTQLLIMAKLFNSLDDAILRDIQLEVLALDSVGNRIAQQRTSFRYLFPNETTGLVQEFELHSGLVVTGVEVRVVDGLIDRTLKYQQPLTVQNTSAFRVGNNYNVTGWLSNADPYTYTQVLLNAVAYNELGQIVGGGQSVFDFVPEEDQVGFSLLVNSRQGEVVDHVDVSPWITSYSASLEGGNWWNSISVDDWNFAVDQYNQITGGAVLENKTDQVLTETYVILTVSDENNQVCFASNDYYDLIWPEETAIYSIAPTELPETCQGRKVDLVVVPGEFGLFPTDFNPLLASQAAFSDQNTVNVSVVNNLNASISHTRVYVVLRDSENRIVGGGYETTGLIRSGSAISINVPVSYLGNQEELTIAAFATLPADVQFGQ